MSLRDKNTVRPEPVEGRLFFCPKAKGKGFDRLSPNGMNGFTKVHLKIPSRR
jgi:hypothetical protein